MSLPRWFKSLHTPFAIVGGVGVFVYSAVLIFGMAPDRWMRPLIVLVVAAVVFMLAFVINVALFRRYRRLTAPRLAESLTKCKTLEADVARYEEDLRSAVESGSTQLRDNEARHYAIYDELEAILSLDYDYCTYLKERGNTALIEELRSELYKYTTELLSHIAALFTRYTGKKCAACVKIYSSSGKEKKELNHDAKRAPRSGRSVFTLARDADSHHERELAYRGQKELYPYTDNTAFFEITHVDERGGYYYKNGLKDLPPEVYRNTNPRWREYYDAVAVAALKNPSNTQVRESIGFLCVDSVDGEFDDQSSRLILACCASIVYYSARTTINMISRTSNRSGR